MKVKNRSIESINRWGKGRCLGKIKGYNKRLNQVASTLNIVNDLGLLTDELLMTLFDVAIKLSKQKRKVYFRWCVLEYNDNRYKYNDDFFESSFIHDYIFFYDNLHNKNIYQRYVEIIYKNKFIINEANNKRNS